MEAKTVKNKGEGYWFFVFLKMFIWAENFIEY